MAFSPRRLFVHLTMFRQFAAIDFETANQVRSSACSVGIVLVEEGVIVDRFYHLIQPAPNYYCHWATACHGLRFEDTAHEIRFPDVWAQVAFQIEGLPLVAHNKGFDEGCLRACFAYYGMRYPEYDFKCTLTASRKAFPHLPNHQLHTVAEHVGFPLIDHHHAMADAEACARIALKVF